MKNMPDHISFDSGQAGASLLVFGAVHGNEKCGTYAIRKWISAFENGDITLLKGKVTFVPIANPKAFENNVRYIDENLNRIVHYHDVPQSYEAGLANALMPLIETHDYLIDLHSYATGSDVFGFLDYPGENETAFAMSLGIPSWASGWPELFYPEEDHTTLAASHNSGNISVTIECGTHDDPEAIHVADNVIEAGLKFLGLIAGEKNQTSVPVKVHAFERVLKSGEGTFTRAFQHMDYLFAGEVIAEMKDGTQLKAPEACHIFLPHETAKIGDEWFYLARQT